MSSRSESEVSAHGTTVERTSDRELVVRRTVDAPARLVFEAWTRPELFQRWWLPKSMGMTVLSCEMDVRTGGSYRLEISHPAAPQPMAFFGRYVEVTPHSRITWTNDENGDGGPVTTVTLEERDGRTHVVVHELHASKEALDAAGTGAAEAMAETFTQLEELIAGVRGGARR